MHLLSTNCILGTVLDGEIAVNTADQNPCIQGTFRSGIVRRDFPRCILNLISQQNERLWLGGCS